MPRWVKVFLGILIVLALLAIVIVLTGLGSPGAHGPSRHAPGMVTGFAVLAVRHAPRCPELEGDTAADDVIPLAGDR
jgi:peptidoglycan/LPS O-acetylase OafA/YrhL